MKLLDSLKSLLGIGDKADANKDGTLDFEEIKSTIATSADTDTDGKIDMSDAKNIPGAISEIKDKLKDPGSMN